MENKNLFFLSRRGLSKIKEEFEKIRKLKLSKMAEEAPKMIVSGDVNEEYLDYYQNMNLIEARLKKLESILKNAVLITPPQKEKRDMVLPGALVTVESEGRKNLFKLTGSIEADPDAGMISVESPVGSALIGHRAGEMISIPSIKTAYRILSVRYQAA